MISPHAQDLLGAREIAAVLPLGAVLAGRVLGDRLAAWTRAARCWLAPVLAVLGAGYLAALGFGAAQPVRPGPNEPLAAWLTAHGLTDGLATYWQANSTNVDSHGRVSLGAVVRTSVTTSCRTCGKPTRPLRSGPPLRQLRGGGRPLGAARHEAVRGTDLRPPGADLPRRGYTILVWDKNLLAELPAGPGRPEPPGAHVEGAAPGHHRQRGQRAGHDHPR